MPTRCALYARVSTSDQHCENQLTELRTVCAARGWTITREYVDHGVSGATEQRPALDALLADARRRRFDVVCAHRPGRRGITNAVPVTCPRISVYGARSSGTFYPRRARRSHGRSHGMSNFSAPR